MPIPVRCAGCASQFNAGDQFAGQALPCPKCGTTILVVPPQQMPTLGTALAQDPLLMAMNSAPAQSRPAAPTSGGNSSAIWIAAGIGGVAAVLVGILVVVMMSGGESQPVAMPPPPLPSIPSVPTTPTIPLNPSIPATTPTVPATTPTIPATPATPNIPAAIDPPAAPSSLPFKSVVAVSFSKEVETKPLRSDPISGWNLTADPGAESPELDTIPKNPERFKIPIALGVPKRVVIPSRRRPHLALVAWTGGEKPDVLWNLRSGKPILETQAPDVAFLTGEISEDGHYFATCNNIACTEIIV